MKVTLQLFGQARAAAGFERLAVELPAPCSAREAVLEAVRGGGAALRSFLLDGDGRPRRSVLLVVGQRQVSWDSAEPLNDGDIVTILPPIAGG